MSGLLPDLPPEHERLARIESMVSELYIAMIGSLKAPGGLLKRVDALEFDVAALKAHRATAAQRLWQITQLPIGAAFGAIASALAEHWHK